MATVAVETAALHADAQMWQDMQTTMREAAVALHLMPWEPSAWSWVAIDSGLLEMYGALLAKATGLVQQGAEAFGSLEEALLHAAAAYESQEEETTEEFEQHWQLRDR